MLKSLSSFIAGPIGVILILFFFLPWVTISCAGSFKIEASGMDLATGNALDELEDQANSLSEGLASSFEGIDDGLSGTTEFSSNDSDVSATEDTALDADPSIWFILVAALIVAGVAGARLFMPAMSEMKLVAGIIYIALGLIALIVQVVKYFDLQDLKSEIEAEQAAEGFTFITMSYSVWWWLTMLGLFMIIIAGLIVLLLEDQLTTETQSASQRSFDLPPVPSPLSPKPPPDDDELPSWMNE